MEIKRDRYLKKIISFMWDGQVKVITGIRRCGKSYLLRNLFKSYLLSEGVAEDHILSFELDLTRDIRYRNPLELSAHVREIVERTILNAKMATNGPVVLPLTILRSIQLDMNLNLAQHKRKHTS